MVFWFSASQRSLVFPIGSAKTSTDINPSESHWNSLCLSFFVFAYILSLQSSIWPSMAASDAQNGVSSVRHAFGNVLAFFILLLIGVLAFSIRLFSVSIFLVHPSSADLITWNTFRFRVFLFQRHCLLLNSVARITAIFNFRVFLRVCNNHRAYLSDLAVTV